MAAPSIFFVTCRSERQTSVSGRRIEDMRRNPAATVRSVSPRRMVLWHGAVLTWVQMASLLQSAWGTCPSIPNYTAHLGQDHPNDDIACGAGDAAYWAGKCNLEPKCLAFNYHTGAVSGCYKTRADVTNSNAGAERCFYTRNVKSSVNAPAACSNGAPVGWCFDRGQTSYKVDCNNNGGALDNVCIGPNGERGIRLWSAGCGHPTTNWAGANGFNSNWPNADVRACPRVFGNTSRTLNPSAALPVLRCLEAKTMTSFTVSMAAQTLGWAQGQGWTVSVRPAQGGAECSSSAFRLGEVFVPLQTQPNGFAEVGSWPDDGYAWRDDQGCMRSQRACGTEYWVTAAYVQRTYEALVVNDDLATSEQTVDLFKVLKYPAGWKEVYTNPGSVKCSTLSCAPMPPAASPPVMVNSPPPYSDPVAEVLQATQTSFTIRLTTFPSGALPRSVAAVFLWPSGSLSGTPTCQFNWDSNGLQSTAEFTVGYMSSFNSQWKNVQWRGSVPDCASESLSCGTKYKILVVPSYMTSTASTYITKPLIVLEPTTSPC